jgi:hypothetical protein
MSLALRFAAIGLALALALVPLPRDVVERVYASGFYPLLQPRLTAFSNAMSFALFDAVVIAAVVVVLAGWLVRWRSRGPGVARAMAAMLFDTLVVCAVLYLWFLVAWGGNYHRAPLHTRLDFDESRINHDALRSLSARMVGELNSLHADAHAAGWPDLSSTLGSLEAGFTLTEHDLNLRWHAEPGRPKRTLFNFYFTRVSIDGMTDPFVLETLANQSLLPFERAATVAHEWGHLAGFATESEASFVGWLVCMRGAAPVRYSGWLGVYGNVVSALPRHEREEIGRSLSAGPREDLRAIEERVRRERVPMASRAGYALYDRYLKANRVESGIRSYGEVLRLMLGTRFTGEGVPVLRK